MIQSLQEVEQQYGKNFDFLKQHASSHVFQDIREKGTTDNFSTRIGEGFQQEAAQAFEQTNMKNAEHQVGAFDSWRCPERPKFLLKMSVIDEKQEAIACIRMAVDNNNLAQLNSDDSDDSDLNVDPDMDSEESQHWQLGSPEGKKSNLRVMSAELGSEREEYKRLDERVRDFIACHMPEEAMRYEEDIHVSLSTTEFTRSSLFI